jgi:hypothetical protein
MASPNGADVGVTADRVSQHQANKKGLKSAKKMFNRGLQSHIELNLKKWFSKVDEEITAGKIQPLIKTEYPKADTMAIGSALSCLQKKGTLARVGGPKSGTYLRVATEVVTILHEPTTDEIITVIMSNFALLESRAKQRDFYAEKARKYDEWVTTLETAGHIVKG